MKGLIAWVSTPFFKIAKVKAPILDVTVSGSLLTCFLHDDGCFFFCFVVKISRKKSLLLRDNEVNKSLCYFYFVCQITDGRKG